MRFAEAKDDCDSALRLELNVKTLLRRGTAWLGLQDIESARKDFKHVLSLEPNNRCCISCHVVAESFQSAAARCDKVLLADPQDADTNLQQPMLFHRVP